MTPNILKRKKIILTPVPEEYIPIIIGYARQIVISISAGTGHFNSKYLAKRVIRSRVSQ